MTWIVARLRDFTEHWFPVPNTSKSELKLGWMTVISRDKSGTLTPTSPLNLRCNLHHFPSIDPLVRVSPHLVKFVWYKTLGKNYSGILYSVDDAFQSLGIKWWPEMMEVEDHETRTMDIVVQVTIRVDDPSAAMLWKLKGGLYQQP